MTYARQAAWPAYMIRAAVIAYGWARHLRAGPAIGAAIQPTAGIVAGDGTAMLIVASYMAQGWRDLLAPLGPRYTQEAYVDDLGVTTFEDKIWVPESLRECIVLWCHENLMHPVSTRMYRTIGNHFTWPGLKKDCEQHCKSCDECQHHKIVGR